MVFWCHVPQHIHFFVKKFFTKDSTTPFKCYFFEVENLIMLQTIGTPMTIDLASFGFNLYLRKHECDFTSKLIEKYVGGTKNISGIFRFIDIFVHLMMKGNFTCYTKKYAPKKLS